MESSGYMRIGELARRTGVSPELLRAWERRYGLLRPQRSDGGFRLYSQRDEERVGEMRAHLSNGLSAAEAARLAVERPVEPPSVAAPADAVSSLLAAVDAFDEAAVQAAIDRLLMTLTLDSVLADVLLPLLDEIGRRWERGELGVAHEHFATNVVRGRLLALARGWDRGIGPRGVLACPPGERHDLGLLAFGLALRARGWRITYLGPDTPVDSLEDAARTLSPDAIVLAALDGSRFTGLEQALRRLAKLGDLRLAGAGADAALARRVGAHVLDAEPVAAAAALAG